jgi:hypothetical protein
VIGVVPSDMQPEQTLIALTKASPLQSSSQLDFPRSEGLPPQPGGPSLFGGPSAIPSRLYGQVVQSTPNKSIFEQLLSS